MDHDRNEPKPQDHVLEAGGIEIEELEDKEMPFDWACITSTSCKCTSSSCAAWAS